MKKTKYFSDIVITAVISIAIVVAFCWLGVTLSNLKANASDDTLLNQQTDEKVQATTDSQQDSKQDVKQDVKQDDNKKVSTDTSQQVINETNSKETNDALIEQSVLPMASNEGVGSNVDPGSNYIEFSSDKSFSLSTSAKSWDGTIYYYDFSKTSWAEWTGTKIDSVLSESAGNKQVIRLAGLNNKVIMGESSAYLPWQIDGDAGSVDCSGDLRYLLDFKLEPTLQPIMKPYCFAFMFYECFALKSAPELSMQNISEYCYNDMFAGCNNLEAAPSLPAFNLKDYCYEEMFAGCSKLTSAPVLEAGKDDEHGYLGESCYSGMFKDCIALINCPELPATELTVNCYSNMFQGCTSLENTPVLLAKNLQESCYSSMFKGCKNLMAPVDLNHVVSLADNCCNFMFKDCSAISVNINKTGLYDKEWKINVKNEPNDWCRGIFDGTKGPYTDDPLINTSYYVYQKPTDLLSMCSDTEFSVATTKSWNGTVQYSTDAVQWNDWDGSKVFSAGTVKQYLYFRGTGNTVVTGQSGLAWTVTGQNVSCEGFVENLLDYAKVKTQEYPQMVDYAFNNLFNGQTALIQGPGLFSVQMSKGCYKSMFEGCTNLKKAPEIAATSLADSCFLNMFNGCSSITRIPSLDCAELAPFCYKGMFAGCSIVTAGNLPATDLKNSCYAEMFKGCKELLCPVNLSSVQTLANDCCKEMYSDCTAMKIYTEPSGLYNIEWKVDANNVDGWSKDMFLNTSGSFKGSPSVFTTYYICQGPSNCVTFTSDMPFSIYVVKQWNGILSYSVDADTWKDMSTGTISSSLQDGSNVIYIRGINNSVITGTNGQQWKFYPSEGSSGISVSGNIENLLDYRRVEAQEHPVMVEGCFANLFMGCDSLISAPMLSGTDLAIKCYYQMFKDCTNLTVAPDLPAQVMADGCYYSMFSGCSALIQTPQLSSTNLASYCYAAMFNDCKALVNVAGDLPATSLKDSCYDSMYKNCKSLITQPVIPTVSLADNCFAYMFSGCESLIEINDINAGDAATNCCKNMYKECTQLTNPPRLNVSKLENGCFYGMFQNCTSLIGTPTLGWSSVASSCYQYMFAGCTSIKTAPILPAMEMESYCYSYMFSGCSNLEEMPSLPSVTLADSCYDHMFENCSKITVTTTLPATVMKSYCYGNMFLNCTSLVRPTDLSHVTQLAPGCCFCMFKDCSLIKVYDEPFYDYTQLWKVQEQTSAQFWSNGMFSGTTGKFTGNPQLGTDYYVYKYEEGYITFTSREPFDVSADKNWDGSVWTSTDSKQWGQPWSGNKVSAVLDAASNEYRLYFKGSNNSQITGAVEGENQPKWTIDGNNVSVIGDIENLLDSKTVAEGKHPVMAQYCFANMFADNESLILSPSLRANNLSDYCYFNMFNGCSSLSSLPVLHAIDLKCGCYQSMFEGCTSIVCPLDMSHVAYVDEDCCKNMYKGCSNIQIRKTEKAPYTNEWIVHAKFSGQSELSWSQDMFADTMEQSEISTPEIGTTYYVLEQTDSYLTFSSITDFTMKRDFKCDGKVSYSYDRFNWNEWKDGDTLDAELTEDDLYCIYVVGSGNTYVNAKNDQDGGIVFEPKVASPSKISCLGNIESILDYKTVSKKEHPSMEKECFYGLFRNCTLLDIAPEMQATTLSQECYKQMYQNCSSLVTAPNLPATKLTYNCYREMFMGCKALTSSPDLPANHLAQECYYGMFSGCESLTKAPALPSSEIKYKKAYSYMFKDCTSLESAPALPATSLSLSCYAYMFEGCSRLSAMPELPATSLESGCYTGMFMNCVNLVTTGTLPADEATVRCYDQMFKGCIKITDAPSVAATKVSEYCYSEMFAGCTSLKTAPQLPATLLYEYCYNKMFEGCSSLVDACRAANYFICVLKDNGRLFNLF